METRTAFTAIFDNGTDVEVRIVQVDERFVLQIKQDSDNVVWVPLDEAKEFASKLNLWAIDNG